MLWHRSREISRTRKIIGGGYRLELSIIMLAGNSGWPRSTRAVPVKMTFPDRDQYDS
jgi:hypothetical protein